MNYPRFVPRIRGNRMGDGLAAIAAASLTLASTGCTPVPTCDTMAMSPLLSIKVEGDFLRVATVRACAADLSDADCTANSLLTDTGTQERQTGASQVPGTWQLVMTGRTSPVRVTLSDATKEVVLDKTVPLAWESKAVDSCHDQDYADVTLKLPAAS